MENTNIIIEIIGAVIGLTYLFLEYKCSVWLWLAGIVMSLFYVVISYNAQLYATAIIYVWYVFTNIYGWLVWVKRRKTSSEDSSGIQNVNRRVIIWSILAVTILWVGVYAVLFKTTESSVVLGDSFIAALSVVATFWLAHKFLQHWWLWVMVNAVSVWVFFIQGFYPSALLFTVYTVVSVFGYFRWRLEI